MKRTLLIAGFAIAISLCCIAHDWGPSTDAAIIKNLSLTRLDGYTVNIVYGPDGSTIVDVLLFGNAKRYTDTGEYYDVVTDLQHWSDLNATWKTEIEQHARAMQKRLNLVGINENVDTLPTFPE